MPNVDLTCDAIRYFEEFPHSQNHDDADAIDSLNEKFHDCETDAASASVQIDVSRREAKVLLDVFDQIEGELAGERQLYWERESGETTGTDCGRLKDIESMLPIIEDAVNSARQALYSPWKMVMVMNGQAFELEATFHSQYPDDSWKSRVREVSVGSLLSAYGCQVVEEWDDTGALHSDAESAMKAAAVSVINAVTDEEAGRY